MKILYFYQYFSTPKGSWGTRVYEFAKEWVKEGHEVTVVSSIYSKSDLQADKLIEDQYFDGIHVKVINVLIDNTQPFFKRVSSFLQYSFISSYYALVEKADVVIASSGPITIGIPGLLAKFIRGRKLVFETRDLWPEGAIELGVLQNKWLISLAYSFESLCYNSAKKVITLSPGMTQDIKRRFPSVAVDDVTNAANIKLFDTPSPHPIKDLVPQTYAIYTGNIGAVNNSYWLFHAAKILKERGRSDIKILLIGEGQQREELEILAAEEGVENFIRLGLMPKQEMIAYLQQAMISLVPLKGSPVLNTSSPNKFFESLAAGVPVIQNTDGWMKDFLIEHNVGYTLSPNDPEQLADLLEKIKDGTENLDEKRDKAKQIARQFFDKKVLAKKMLTMLEDVYEQK
ncbi:MAG: glycosyltransferase family 4 protein [Fulvivirga sp.]